MNHRRVVGGLLALIAATTTSADIGAGGEASAPLNISTNGTVASGESMVAGFIVEGNVSRRYLIMAESIGPEPLSDAMLQLRTVDGTLLAENDNWTTLFEPGEIAALVGRDPNTPLDGALVYELVPGVYLAEMSGQDGGGGTGLVSVTELDKNDTLGGLVNISTNSVIPPDEAMIAGFILSRSGTFAILAEPANAPGAQPPGLVLSAMNSQSGMFEPFADAADEQPALSTLIEAIGRGPENEGVYLITPLEAGAYLASAFNRTDSTQRQIIAVNQITTDDNGDPPGENQAPIANDDSADVDSEESVVIDVLANDTDPDGELDRSSITITSTPSRGSVAVNQIAGNMTYSAPSTQVDLSVNFSYRVSDDQGEPSNLATVRVEVNGIAPPPPSCSQRTCSSFSNCSAVHSFLNQCPQYWDDLDRDGDGTPCESLCG